MSDVFSKPFVEYKEEGKYGTKLREPTSEERAAAELRRGTLKLLRERVAAIEAEIDTLEKECPHTVSYDLAGFPYDIRMCYACGAGQGRV